METAIQIATFFAIVTGIAIQLRTQFNVAKVEKATNSMKDALVAATAKSAGLEGEARGRAEQKANQPNA